MGVIMSPPGPLCTIMAAALLVAPAAGSSSQAGADDRRGQQPGAFCIPDGWQSGKAVTRGVTVHGSRKPDIIRSLGDVIYSSSQQKLWIDDFMMSGDSDVPTTRLYDYPGRILYTVRGRDGEKNQTCTKTTLLSPFKPLCVPVNATMTKIKSYYGDTPPYIQFFMEFAGRAEDPDTDTDVSYRLSLAREHQTPLFQQVWGKENGERVFKTSEFFNSTIWGSMPPDIFTPPRICRTASLTTMQTSSRQQETEPQEPIFLL